LLVAAFGGIGLATAYYRTVGKPLHYDINAVELHGCSAVSASSNVALSLDACMDSEVTLAVTYSLGKDCKRTFTHADIDMYLITESSASNSSSSSVASAPFYVGSAKITRQMTLRGPRAHNGYNKHDSHAQSMIGEVGDHKHQHHRNSEDGTTGHHSKQYVSLVTLPAGSATNQLLASSFAGNGTKVLLDTDVTVSHHVFYGHQFFQHQVAFSAVSGDSPSNVATSTGVVATSTGAVAAASSTGAAPSSAGPAASTGKNGHKGRGGHGERGSHGKGRH